MVIRKRNVNENRGLMVSLKVDMSETFNENADNSLAKRMTSTATIITINKNCRSNQTTAPTSFLYIFTKKEYMQT